MMAISLACVKRLSDPCGPSQMAMEYCQVFMQDLENLLKKTDCPGLIALCLEILADMVDSDSADWSVLVELLKEIPQAI